MKSWLYIDTRTRASAEFGWISPAGDSKLWKVDHGSPGLMSTLVKKIKLHDLHDALGICLVSGPGSFSSVRMGALVANLLSDFSSLPLYALVAQADFQVSQVPMLILGLKPVKYAPPVYDQEPNITVK